MTAEELFHEVVQTMSRWSPKGQKLLSHGVRLICPTPHVAPEAWLHVRYPPLEPDETKAMEIKLGMMLPDDFKSFLLKANGLEMFSYTISIWGIRKNYERTGDEAWQPFDLVALNDVNNLPDGGPPDVVYFSSADRGNTWCFFEFDAKGYRVGKTDRHDFRPDSYWSDFGSWLLHEMRSLDGLFDDDGVMVIDGSVRVS